MSANGKWPHVPLEDVVIHRKEFIQINDLEKYKRCRVQLHAQGVVLRDEVEGSLIKTKKQQVCHANEFLVAEIDAKMGGFGLVPSELEGAVVSSHYFLFSPIVNRLDPQFLGYYSRTVAFRSQVESRGSTNYAAIRPAHVLGYTIPLPPLEDQRRIVARVDSLVAKIDEAKTLRKQSTSQLNAVAVSLAHRGDLTDDEKLRMGWKAIRLGDFIRTEYDDHKVQTCEEYPNLGIYSYGRGLFAKPPISGMATSAAKLRKVHSGQFIYSRLFAWEGAFGLVTPEFDGWYVSGEYPTFACDQHHILPEFLFAYFKTEQAWKKVAIGSKGLGSRRQRVQPEQILNHCLLLPPMDIQEKIKWTLESAVKGRIQILEAEASIDVLLPSILDRAFQGGL